MNIYQIREFQAETKHPTRVQKIKKSILGLQAQNLGLVILGSKASP